MIYTTLWRLRCKFPRRNWDEFHSQIGMKSYDSDAPISLLSILDGCGLEETLRLLKVEHQHAKLWRLYAVRCARRAIGQSADVRLLSALDTAELYAIGKVKRVEFMAARADVLALKVSPQHRWDAYCDAVHSAICRPASEAPYEAAKDAVWCAVLGLRGEAEHSEARAVRIADLSSDLRVLLIRYDAEPGQKIHWWRGLKGEQA